VGWLGVALLYSVVCSISLAYIQQLGTPAPFWPGIGVGVGLLLGMHPVDRIRAASALFVGAFVPDVAFGYPVLHSLGLAAVNALEPLAVLLAWSRWSSCGPRLDRLEGVVAFVGAAFAAAAGASVAGGLLLRSLLDAPLLLLCFGWFVDDVVGTLVVAPLFVAWSAPSAERRARWFVELGAMLALVGVTVGLTVAGPPTVAIVGPVLCSPLLLWAALSTGPRGYAVVAAAVAASAVGVALWGEGAIAGLDLSTRAHLLQTFLVASVVPSLLLLGLVGTRDHIARQLTRQEARYHQLLDGLEDGVWQLDLDAHIVYANPRIAELLGTTVDAMIGRPVFQFLPPASKEQARKLLAERRQGVHHTVQTTLRPTGGDDVPVELAAAPVLDADGRYEGSVGVFRDLRPRLAQESERASLQAQLQQAQKLEAVGQLASGIAHDFNNLLTTVLAYSDLIEPDTPVHELSEYAEAIGLAARRGSDLTRQLLTLGRATPMELRPLDLCAHLEQTLGLSRRVVGDQVELLVDLPSEPVPVVADPSQLDQVLLNLLLNARDALGPGGRVHVSLSVHASSLGGSRGDSRWARIAVRDEGCGIAPDHLERIFEPFFTTKGVGEGTGLGLATSRSILRHQGGDLVVDSELGRGSTFTLQLPLQAVDPTPSPAPDISLPPFPTQTFTVLVVDDDPQLFRLVHRVLTQAGYTVIGGTTPAEALDAARNAESVQLLVSDVVMPGKSGPELREELVEVLGDVPTLYMSGYPRGYVAGGDSPGLLLKPFGPNDLLKRVGKLLGA
jgi:PAS domain S-box-containing protein